MEAVVYLLEKSYVYIRYRLGNLQKVWNISGKSFIFKILEIGSHLYV